MPIRLPRTLPAFETLRTEGVSLLPEGRADRQDIRPLRIALLNLMPLKEVTETQFARLIGATPLQIDFHLIRMSDHNSKHTDASHLSEFYKPFRDVQDQRYDGLIITGAPIEHLVFSKVDYWQELTKVFDWTQTHVHHTMAVCWAGMAALNYFYDIPKDMLTAKRFGCFRHKNLAPASPYLSGLSDSFLVPVSRWTEIQRQYIQSQSDVELLLDSEIAGPCLMESRSRNMLFNLNHFEYDSNTLKGEYDRDVAAGKPINIPDNYYPKDDPTSTPQNLWKSSAHLLYGNWISEIYQTTPFDINKIGIESHDIRI